MIIRQYSICTYFREFPEDSRNGSKYFYLGQIPNNHSFSLVASMVTGLVITVVTAYLTEDSNTYE